MSGLVQDFIGAAALVKKHNLRAYVETGVEDGISMDVARNIGVAQGTLMALYGCDVDGEKVALCRAKFPEAQISHATSTDFLLDVLPQIREPALFWLDAHFKDGYPSWPLREELTLISQMLRLRDASVIIADDFSCVLSKSLTDFDPTERNGDPRFV